MSEQELQSKIIQYITARGDYVVKVVTATKSGVPDLIACINRRGTGHFVGIEVKVGKNKASALQMHNIDAIKKAGGFGFVVYSLEEFIQLVYT